MSVFEAMVLEKALAAMTQRAEQAEEEVRNLRLVCDAAEAEWNRAETELAAMKQPCVWKLDRYGAYQDTCNDEYWDDDYRFCPNCGHPVSVVRVAE